MCDLSDNRITQVRPSSLAIGRLYHDCGFARLVTRHASCVEMWTSEQEKNNTRMLASGFCLIVDVLAPSVAD